MKLSKMSKTRAAIAAIGLLACGLGVSQVALGSGGGLSISPSIFKQVAGPGPLGAVEVSNTTRAPMSITLVARPWLQSASGIVSPDRRRTLGKVQIHPGSFRLAAGTTRAVGISLSRRPPRGSIYGALEVLGSPKGHHGGNGVRVAYRLVTTLRLYPRPGTQVLSARAGRLLEQGSARHGTLLLAVRNTGNTIIPIDATVQISGMKHSLHGNAVAKTIVPGATVNLPLVRLVGAIPRGRYKVTVHLSQGGHPIGTVRRHGVQLR